MFINHDVPCSYVQFVCVIRTIVLEVCVSVKNPLFRDSTDYFLFSYFFRQYCVPFVPLYRFFVLLTVCHRLQEQQEAGFGTLSYLYLYLHLQYFVFIFAVICVCICSQYVIDCQSGKELVEGLPPHLQG